MSSIDVQKSSFNKVLDVPTSKSYGNRLLILASQIPRPITLKNIPLSTDVETMICCLQTIGVDIERSDQSIIVKNSFPACERAGEDVLELDTGDGGTTNRFLLALLALGKRTYLMKMKGDMKKRPMVEMELALKKCGCHINNVAGNITIRGPLHHKGKLAVDSSKTTQFITAFKMIESQCEGLSFEPRGLQTSKLYYEMTLSLIKELKTIDEFIIPVDFSSIAYPIAAGLTLGEVKVSNCKDIDAFQADSILFQLIEDMGGDISIGSSGLLASSTNRLSAIEIDCRGFPDLVPTLAYLCSYAEGESTLKNLEVLTYKESNRFEEIKNLLDLFEIEHREDGYDMTIIGTNKSCGPKEYFPKPDHRMIMVGYLFMRKNNGGKLHSIEHVSKSYGNFFDQMS